MATSAQSVYPEPWTEPCALIPKQIDLMVKSFEAKGSSL